MSEACNYSRRAGRHAALIVWPVVATITVAAWFHFGPSLEKRFVPFLVNQNIDEVERINSETACFRWTFDKARDAHVVSFAWAFAVNDIAVFVPAIVQRSIDGKPINHDQVSPSRERHQIDGCAKIPLGLQEVADLSLKGVIAWKPDHGLWSLVQTVPPIDIPLTTGTVNHPH